MSNLVIVESPTKAKTIKKILGKEFEVAASMGHLRDLPRSTFGVDVQKEFEPHYINIVGKSELIKKLKEAAQNADKVYLATDPDREGEAISWHLAQILNIDPKEECRIEVHEITPNAIKTAITQPRSIDMSKFKAQEARRIIDRIVGYELSPLLWQKIMRGLSAGRVQSVAVKIIADREKQIDEFVPEEYWTIVAKFKEDDKAIAFEARLVKENGNKLDIKDEVMASNIEKELVNAKFIVTDASIKSRKRHAIPPFTTSTLQQEANKQLNFNSKRTMSIAQQLFEGITLENNNIVGLITYMRTDSVRVANVALQEIRQYIQVNFGDVYLPTIPNYYVAKKNAQDAHEAIRPTNIFNSPEKISKFLTKEQLDLYTLIWKRTVASQMTEAIYEQIQIDISAGKYSFTATGSELKFDGYRRVSGKDYDEEKSLIIPYVKKGTELILSKLMPAEQHFTEPPAHYTEASLINKLETEGIGRPSTYAPTIQTIITRNYVSRSGKKLLITELGIQVNDLLTKYFPKLIDLPFSAEMEDNLDKIAEGEMERNTVIEHFYIPFAKDITIAKDEIAKIPPRQEISDIKCELCGSMMIIKSGKFGKFLACPNYPKCKNTKPIIKKIGVSCPKCGGEILERKTKTGKNFFGCENYPKCDFCTWDKPVNKKCELCGSIMVERSDKIKKVVEKCSNHECENGVKRHVRSVKNKSKKE